MTDTIEKFQTDYDAAKGRPTKALRSGGLAANLVELTGFTGIKYGAAIDKRLINVTVLETEFRGEASALRSQAEDVLKAAPKEQKQADALKVLAGIKGDDPALASIKFGADKVAKAQEALAAANRMLQAVEVALDAANRDLYAEVTSPAFFAKLEKVWADRVALQPTEEWTLGEMKAAAAVADEVARLVANLATALSPEGDATRGERRRLRQAFKERPPVMPTLAAIRAAMRSEAENTPHAKALRAAEASKAADKEQADRLADSYKTDAQRERAAAAANNS